MPEEMPDRMSDRMPEDMPDRMPEDLPDRIPEDLPEHMPEDMSDRKPEDLRATKCINVMVGITRSKAILVILYIYIFFLNCILHNVDINKHTTLCHFFVEPHPGKLASRTPLRRAKESVGIQTNLTTGKVRRIQRLQTLGGNGMTLSLTYVVYIMDI
jgi:hypothetical protein